jgi:hypothetical protein
MKFWFLLLAAGVALSALGYWLLTEDAPEEPTHLEAWRQIERSKKDT